MAEYIKRDAAMQAFLAEKPDAHYPGWYAGLLEELPAADVAPVVHGKPVTKIRTVTLTTYHEEIGHFAADGANLYRKKMTHAEIPYEHCSVCGATLCSRWHNFCGKCGARMDGGVDDAAD